MLRERLQTSGILIAVVIACYSLGSLALAVLAAVVAIISIYEIYLISTGLSEKRSLMFALLFLLPIIAIFSGSLAYTLIAILLLVLIQCGFILYVVEHDVHISNIRALLTGIALGLFYPGMFCLSLVALCWNYPKHYALMLLIAVALADTAAYFGGSIIGGPKLAPRISPNKTVSGAACGIIAAMLGILGFSFFVCWTGAESIGALSIVQVLCVGAALALASIVGDLTESLCKRSFDVKDSGSILPGHGGVLDRVDGLIAAAPLLLFILML